MNLIEYFCLTCTHSQIFVFVSWGTHFQVSCQIGGFVLARTPIYDCISAASLPNGSPLALKDTFSLNPLILRLIIRCMVTHPRFNSFTPWLLSDTLIGFSLFLFLIIFFCKFSDMAFFCTDFGDVLDGVGVGAFKDLVFRRALITFMVVSLGDEVIFLSSFVFDTLLFFLFLTSVPPECLIFKSFL